jgi:hypothetical protein
MTFLLLVENRHEHSLEVLNFGLARGRAPFAFKADEQQREKH